MSKDKCSKDLYKEVQNRKVYVDDGKGNFNFVHQTDVWYLMECAFEEGRASKIEEAQNSTSNTHCPFSGIARFVNVVG